MKQHCQYPPCNNTFIDHSRTSNRKYCSSECGYKSHYYQHNAKQGKFEESESVKERRYIAEHVNGGVFWGDEVCLML